MKEMHRLLRRQLKKYFASSSEIPPDWKGFVDDVASAYSEFDEDRRMLERALDLSSQELLQANSEMRVIFKAIPDLLFTFDLEGTILDCKAGSITDLYLTPEKVIGKKIQNIPPQHVGKQFLDSMHEVQKSKKIVSFEYSIQLQGQTCFYEARLMPLLNTQIIAIVRNITSAKMSEAALVESEKEYRTLVENINVGIYRTSDDFRGRFMQANPAMVKIFGYPSLDDFLKTNVSDLYQDFEERKLFLGEIAEKGAVKERELHMKRKDGMPIVISCTAISNYDENGVMRWIDGVMEDITERKLREEELLKTSKLESIGILAGGIAHDFNNILTAIIGNICLARTMTNPESELAVRLAEAEKASLRAQDLTLQLLTFAKGGAPIKKLSSVADLLRESANFVLSGSNVRCDFRIADNLLPADIDQGQISQVINNLVINSKQAMPGGGTILIEADNVFVGGKDGDKGLPLANGTYIKITIRDEGMGIAPEDIDKIFDPYFSTKQTGSGLGLTTSYAVIKKHGGHIAVASKPGQGTKFSIYLPAARGAIEQKEETVSVVPTGKGRILFMDDQEIVRDVVGGMLDYLGYEVSMARDGAEAIALLECAVSSDKRFDAVIMDLTIPGGMGGKEAAARISAIDPHVQIIASSGYSNDPIMADYKKFGFSAIMPKPVRLEDIRDVLSQALS